MGPQKKNEKKEDVLKSLLSYLNCSQIWLNLPVDEKKLKTLRSSTHGERERDYERKTKVAIFIR
jgi:hypothetical protein